jgi:putative endonuclease
MYCVYIIYSRKLNRFYTGTTDNFKIRLIQHNSKTYLNSFTCKGIPWIAYHIIDNLTSKQAYDIERHIKKMKSKKYIENLLKYPEIIVKLRNEYSE